MSELELKSNINGILVGHGELPFIMLKTIQAIMGPQENIQVISNEHCSGAELKKQLDDALADLGNRNVVIFVDLEGGSCGIISRQILRDRKDKNIVIVCGVNVPMLIKFFQYRNELEFYDLIKLLEETGKREIKVIGLG